MFNQHFNFCMIIFNFHISILLEIKLLAHGMCALHPARGLKVALIVDLQKKLIQMV